MTARRILCEICKVPLPPPKQNPKHGGGRPRVVCTKAACRTERRKLLRRQLTKKRKLGQHQS